MARSAGGEFLLRVEDIDTARCRPEWEELIFEDLAWLGLTWDGSVMRQSERTEAYKAALDDLRAASFLYPCTCTRKDIQNALSAPQEGAVGFDGPPYPGTCRNRTEPPAKDFALRLNMKKATQDISNITFCENLPTPMVPQSWAAEAMIQDIGDVVIARKDIGTSYHLAVVVDDAQQGITDVVRGEDLAFATPVQVLLQKLLGLPTPKYHHHALTRDETGHRLAKRDDAKAIRKFRNEGATPEDIRLMVGLA